MSWITIERVELVLQQDLSDDTWLLELIDHVQGLAEVEIGEQTTPSNKLKSVFAEIVARKWQDGKSAQLNPEGYESETAGPFSRTSRTAGLGLTNREKLDLRAAVGKTGLWVQPTSRGPGLETAPASGRARPSPEELVDVVGGEPAIYINPDDLNDL